MPEWGLWFHSCFSQRLLGDGLRGTLSLLDAASLFKRLLAWRKAGSWVGGMQGQGQGQDQLTGDGKVGGGLHLAGCVAGKALEHARVVGHQPADLQSPVAALPEAAQPLRLHHGRVLVPSDGGRWCAWGRDMGARSAPLLAPSRLPLSLEIGGQGEGKGAGNPWVSWFLESSQRCYFMVLEEVENALGMAFLKFFLMAEVPRTFSWISLAWKC